MFPPLPLSRPSAPQRMHPVADFLGIQPRSGRVCGPIRWGAVATPVVATTIVRNAVPAQPPLWADSYAPGVPLHLDYGDTTVLDLWESAAQHHPDRPALDFLGRVSTYAEVDAEVRRVAGGLHALGVRPGDNVALVMPNCPQNVIAFFAVLRLGADRGGAQPALHRGGAASPLRRPRCPGRDRVGQGGARHRGARRRLAARARGRRRHDHPAAVEQAARAAPARSRRPARPGTS